MKMEQQQGNFRGRGQWEGSPGKRERSRKGNSSRKSLRYRLLIVFPCLPSLCSIRRIAWCALPATAARTCRSR